MLLWWAEFAVHTARYFHCSERVFHLNTMARAQLRDEQWEKIEAVLESQRGAGRRGSNDRNFVEAVLWWRRTGVPWRDLPSEFGSWKTVFNRFDRWSKRGSGWGCSRRSRRIATMSGTASTARSIVPISTPPVAKGVRCR